MSKPDSERCAGDIALHVGARIRERRIMMGMIMRKLAEAVGVTEQQMSKWERGIDNITAGQLYEVARALYVGPDHFFEGVGEPVLVSDRKRERKIRKILQIVNEIEDDADMQEVLVLSDSLAQRARQNV